MDMDYKTEYITRLFQKASNKRIEHYCLSRLWHRLDNDRIKFVPQQYVGRHDDKYALTDVFLPQFRMHIEVNEPAHYDNPEKIKADQFRKDQIERNTGHSVHVIDCRQSIANIHQQIDVIIGEILERLKADEKSGKFRPWDLNREHDPLFWKPVGHIKVEDDIALNNIEAICTLFDADFKKTQRGFLRKGGIPHPRNPAYFLWWPSDNNRQGWSNILSEDWESISETNSDKAKNSSHFEKFQNTSQKRIVFFHHKDILGLTSYKFIGIFEYDLYKSNLEKNTTWKRTAKMLKL
jgi:hypothetical protein